MSGGVEAQPAVSVVLTMDYGVDEDQAWDDLRTTLHALTGQDFAEPFEVLYVEDRTLHNRIPHDLHDIAGNLRIVLSGKRDGYSLVQDGVRAARTTLVATLDGDCVPATDWLRRLVERARADERLGGACGRTIYRAEGGWFLSTLALFQRGGLEGRRDGDIDHVSNNNAIYRREAFLKHPIGTKVGPFGTAIQGREMQEAGYRLSYVPGAIVVHRHDGWSFERMLRLQSGFASIRARQIDPRLRRAWIVRLGWPGIPLIVAWRTLRDTVRCIRYGRRYGVKWFVLPVAPLLALTVHLFEVPGMWHAFRDRPVPVTKFR